MGSIYYQQSNNLDSLSDVSGFSAALNGKTYGLKKQGGQFVPSDVSSGGGGITGIIPDAGLYIDGVNRVGVLVNTTSGLATGASGVSVLPSPTGGLENTATGLSIKETDSIDPNGPNVKVDGTLKIDSNGVGVNIVDNTLINKNPGLGVNIGTTLETSSTGQLNVLVSNNLFAGSVGVGVRKGLGFTTSNTNLNIGAGDGISVNTNDISVRYDNSTITAPGGILQANFGTIPAFGSVSTSGLANSFSFGGSGTSTTILPTTGTTPVTMTIPSNWSAIFSFYTDITADSNGITFNSNIRPNIGLNNTTGLSNVFITSGDYWQGFNDGTSRSGVYVTKQYYNGTATNLSSSSVSTSFSIAHTGPDGTGMQMLYNGGFFYVYLFPVSP